MKRIIYTIIAVTCLFSFANAQFDYGCNGERYVLDQFTDISQEEVLFGRNVEPNGDSIDLFMDVYYPQSDNADARPIIILAHSGAFISGDKAEMAPFCERLAKLGYVAATIDYRLLDILNGIPDSVGAMDIAVKASHDMKAAIRYLKHSAANDNEYNIDGNMMFIGGYSAGAITAVLTGALDEGEITQDFLLDIVNDNGGFEGNSGNPDYLDYDTEVRGILNLSGAIYDTTWIDSEDPIIQSFHGTNDGTVGFGKAFATVFGVNIISLHGSGNIIQRTENLGVPGYLHTVEGGDHVDIYIDAEFEQDRTIFTGHSDTTFAKIICGTLVDVFEQDQSSILIYPNPVNDQLFIDGIDMATDVYIYNHSGQMVMYNKLDQSGSVNVSHLASGIYTCQIKGQGISHSKSFVIIE